MKGLTFQKKLTIVNFLIVGYFILLYLVNLYQIDFVIIGVFRELLTIPFFLAQIIFLIIGFKSLVKIRKNDFLFILSFILLVICSLLTFGSFFYYSF